METKINIAEILKDCPSGMELDCAMYEDVYFDEIFTNSIKCYYINNNTKTRNTVYFNRYGEFFSGDNSKCVIFPKGKTTWEGFVPPCKFKDGDIVVSEKGDIHLLRTSNSSYCAFREQWGNKFDCTITTSIKVVRFATEEEKQKLFDAIKANGYKWNAKIKTLEKLKKEYPKTYAECCDVLGIDTMDNNAIGYKYFSLMQFQELLIARDAYWKIAGEEMGLGKSWKPDFNSGHFIPAIIYKSGFIQRVEVQYRNVILAFPTKEMRDAFYENFKDLIEQCEELL